MKASDIDQVLLVGGSSRIPKVQQILQEMFPQTELARRINPDEVRVHVCVHTHTHTHTHTHP